MDQPTTLTTGWEPDTPLADATLRQFVFAYADRVDRDPAACIADAGSAFGYDNAAVVLQPPAETDLGAVLGRAHRLFAPERWWIQLSAWPRFGSLLNGMSLVGHQPLMLRAPGPFSVAQASGLRICPVDDRRHLADFDAVLKAGCPLPRGAAVADHRLLGPHLRLLVGYDGDQPVATAGACTTNGIVEIGWVATLPTHRRQAIGAAMTAAAASTDPARPTVLLASDDGTTCIGGSASSTCCASRSGSTIPSTDTKGDRSMTDHHTARDALAERLVLGPIAMRTQMTLDRLDPEDVESFTDHFVGEVIRPADDGYEEHRRVWNGMIDKHPALIARCRSREDVVSAVNFAREQGLPLAVRGGGHSFAGFSTCDGGVVLDLSNMHAVEVNADRQVARAEGGVTWGVFDAATHAHGLASTGGLISTTGIAGLTLGGGIGWLQRKCGLACDNLLSVELVTADGEIIRASEAENRELFWGLRGGGGNFGVVTSFEFRLHPVSSVVGGLLLFPAGRAAEVMRFYRDYVRSCPDELTTWLSAITAPAADFVPEDLQGKAALAVLACHCGDPADAERALRPLRALGPAADLIESMPYPALQSMLDEDLPAGVRCYLKAGYTAELTDPLIGAIVEHIAAIPSASSSFDIHHMGGAVARVADDATAFGDRRSAFCFNIVGVWHDPSDDGINRDWVRAFASALEPFGTGGVYVNFTSEPGAVSAAYGHDKYARLRALKRRYDPTNVFRLNQNIKG